MSSTPRQSLLVEVLPSFASEIESLLTLADKPELAAQVAGLKIVDHCNCGDDFCATFYTQPKPSGTYGPNHSNVELEPESGMIILDVVSGLIVKIEVLYRDDVKRMLQKLTR